MALGDSRTKIFDDLWCLGASGDLEFCVSSTSYQKSNIGWPRQPPTEKLPRFNLTFHDSTKKYRFHNIKSNINISWNQEPGWLKSSLVIFEPLETSAASLTSSASETSLASTALFSQKNFSPWWYHHPWNQNDQY